MNDDSIATHMYCHVLSVLLTGQKKKKKKKRRGGGVAALFKDVYQCKQVSFGQYLSFEYLGIVLKGAPRILFIIIYRPPKYSPAFVEEFTELLSMISS